MCIVCHYTSSVCCCIFTLPSLECLSSLHGLAVTHLSRSLRLCYVFDFPIITITHCHAYSLPPWMVLNIFLPPSLSASYVCKAVDRIHSSVL